MDWLAAATGAVTFPEGEAGDAARRRLDDARRAAAADFLLCGGRVSPSDWLALSSESRAAFKAAAVALETDRANLIAATILRHQAGGGA